MEKVKRTRKITVAQVVTPEGEPVGEVTCPGTASPPRLANVARREFKNPMLTVRNIRVIAETYSMPSSKFFELAEKEN